MIQLRITCAGAPLLIEGTIGDRRVYYRSGHGRWRVELDDVVIAAGDHEQDDQERSVSRALLLIAEHTRRVIWDDFNQEEDAREAAAESGMFSRGGLASGTVAQGESAH